MKSLNNHHAPWRLDQTITKGSLEPIIYNPGEFKEFANLITGPRFILTTCDYDFLIKYFDRLRSYQNSDSQIPFYIGIFSEFNEEQKTKIRLDELKFKNGLGKIRFFVFSCIKLSEILAIQESSEIKWDYKINYIRNARYNLVIPIWKMIGVDYVENIREACTYIVDFDNIFKGDLNHAIKKKYGDLKMLFSWNSAQSPNKDFPKTLSGLKIINSQYSTNHAYKIIKAGFTVLAPCEEVSIWLGLYKNYSIGDEKSAIFMRLFTFYFSDQMSMLFAIKDLKSVCPEILKKIDWLDINTSSIVNLNPNKSKYMHYPKGITLKPPAG